MVGMDKLTIMAAGFCLALAGSSTIAAPQAPPQQITTGTIMGHVRDTAGKPLAHIPVEVMQTAEFVFTDKDGGYVFSQENPGIYTVAAIGAISPAVRIRTQVTMYSRVVMPCTLKSAGTTVCNFSLVLLGAKWISPSPSPILKDYSGPGTAQQSPQEDVFPGDVSLHSTARSR